MKSEANTVDPARNAEALIPLFQLDKVLSQDRAGCRAVLHGTIRSEPALLLVERAPFPSASEYLAALPGSLARLQCINANDIYSWHRALAGLIQTKPPSPSSTHDAAATTGDKEDFFPDLKIDLIYPCTELHVKKYARQEVRFVTETPELYAAHVRPYMERKRAGGRLNWVYNIIEGRAEADDVVFRTPLGQAGPGGQDGFLLAPDRNWDQTTLSELRLLALVERRDLWSIRDLRKSHVPWLRHMKEAIVDAVVAKYPPLERDQVKLYFHYQPTYYHLHIHVVNAAAEGTSTQATGKAVGLESVIELLEAMDPARAETEGIEGVSLSYTIGEAHELWAEVYAPLKLKEKSQAL